ncbi:MAG: DUF4833 domain-containing protein [Bacteroidales bacterium]|nr:DUF4833 domain-containing protein [Bacteroidales bacterium]
MKTILLLISYILIPVFHSIHSDGTDNPAGEHNYPVPQRNEKLLFFVQRTHNRNTIAYELNLKPDGTINQGNPLHAYWIRYEEGGQRKELSSIQRMLYGLEIQKGEKGRYSFHFKYYKKKELYLIPAVKANSYKAMIVINGKMAEFTHLFIASVTNSLGVPSSVKYIDIYGIDPASGSAVNERVIP